MRHIPSSIHFYKGEIATVANLKKGERECVYQAAKEVYVVWIHSALG